MKLNINHNYGVNDKSNYLYQPTHHVVQHQHQSKTNFVPIIRFNNGLPYNYSNLTNSTKNNQNNHMCKEQQKLTNQFKILGDIATKPAIVSLDNKKSDLIYEKLIIYQKSVSNVETGNFNLIKADKSVQTSGTPQIIKKESIEPDLILQKKFAPLAHVNQNNQRQSMRSFKQTKSDSQSLAIQDQSYSLKNKINYIIDKNQCLQSSQKANQDFVIEPNFKKSKIDKKNSAPLKTFSNMQTLFRSQQIPQINSNIYVAKEKDKGQANKILSKILNQKISDNTTKSMVQSKDQQSVNSSQKGTKLKPNICVNQQIDLKKKQTHDNQKLDHVFIPNIYYMTVKKEKLKDLQGGE